MARALALTIVFSIIVAFCAVTFVFGGNGFTSYAEADAIIPTYTYNESEMMVTKIGDEELALNDDVTFEITSLKGDGLIMCAIYAEYTDSENEKVCLAYDDSTDRYILYGVQGDFILVGEWVAKTFEPTWTCDTSKGTITGTTPTVIQVGMGLPMEEMPSVDGVQGSSSMYYSDGWTVTGTLIGGSSYSLGYIPENAISATCTAKLTDGSTHVYYTTADVDDGDRPTVVGEGTFNTDNNKSNGAPVGVYAAGDTTDPYSGIDSTVNTNGTKYRFGFLGHKSNNGSGRPYNKRLDAGCNSTFTNDAGNTEYYNGMGFYREKTTRSSTDVYDHSMLVIPIRFDNELKRDLLAGTISGVKVTVTARILVGAKNVSSNARTNAWLNLEEGIKTRLTNFSYSGNTATVTGYPRSYIDGAWVDNFAYVNSDSKNPCTITSGYISSTDWGVAQGKYSKTIYTSATSGFTIGFRATYYTNSGGGVTKHFALINSLVYTIEAVDANGNSTVGQKYTVNLNSNNGMGAPLMEGAEESEISATSLENAWSVPYAPWSYNGYSFVGWSTTPELQEGLSTITELTAVDGVETIYYAIWEKKKYPFVVYDSYTDGTNYARVHREYSVFEHGAQNLVVPNADGGGDYIGFSEPVMLGSVSNGGPVLIGFERTLLAPTIDSISRVSVVYGTPIDLDASVTASHVSPRAQLTNVWKTASDQDIVFSGAEHIIYNAPESGEYKVIVTASVVIENTIRGSQTLAMSTVSEPQLYEIEKIELDLAWTLDGESDFTIPYDGQEHIVSVTPSGMVNGESVTINLQDSSATNAGTYTATATLGDDVINYVLPENVTKSYEITKIELSLTWTLDGESEFSVPYNGLTRVVSATPSGMVNDESVTINMEDNVQKNTGRYLARATLADADTINYVLPTNVTQLYEIERIELTLTWTLDGESEFSVPYKGVERVVSVTANGMANGESVTINLSGNLATNVGIYTATATLADADTINYVLPAIATKDYEIVKAEITLTWTLDGESEFMLVYDGSEHVISVAPNGIADGESVTVNLSGSVATNVGTYLATATLSEEDTDNYVLSALNTKAYEITQKEVSVSWLLNGEETTSIIYNAQVNSVVAVINGIVGDDVVTPEEYDGVLSATDKGIYRVTLKAISNDNYKLPTENLTFTWSIDGLSFNASWTGSTYTYNGSYQYPDLVVDGFEAQDTVYFNIVIRKGISVILEAMVSANGSDGYTFTSGANALVGASIDAGTYTISCDGVVYDENSNANLKYEISEELQDQEYVIDKKVIDGTGVWTYTIEGVTTVYTEETTLVYVNKEYKIATSLVDSSIETRADTDEKDVISLVYIDNVKVNVGEYVASLSIDSNNYKLGENYEFNYQITAKEVTFTWSLDGGSDFSAVYDASVKEAVVTIGGVIEGTSCEVKTINGNKATNVGEYTAIVIELTNANYAIPANSSQSFVITARAISLEWTNIEFVYDGTVKGVTAEIVNLAIIDDVCELEYSLNQATSAGDYQASVIGVSNANYTLVGGTNLTYNWSIAKKELTLVWTLDNASEFDVTYNGKARNLEVTAEGIVLEDVVTLTMDGTLIATNVGDYTASVTGIDNANYVLPEQKNVSWSIVALPVAVEWSGSDFAYNGNTQSVKATIINLIAGDVVNFDYADNQKLNAGSYIAEISNLTNANYTLVDGTNLTYAWEIGKVVVELEWALDGVQDKTYVLYDGNAHEVTAIVTNAVDGESVLVTAYTGVVVMGAGSLTNGNVASEISTYRTLVATLSDEDNYAISDSAYFEWAIQMEKVTVTLDGDSFVYNGQAQGITAIVSGISASDINEVVALTDGSVADNISQEVKDGKIYVYFNATNVGTYTATISGLDGAKKDNYTLYATSVEFEITALMVEISWTANGGAYEKANLYATASVTNKALESNDIAFEYTTIGTSYSVEGANGIGNVAVNVGEYITTIIALDNDNYTLVGATNLSVEWSITAKKITEFNWSTNTFVYANTAYAMTAEAVTGATLTTDGKLYDGDTLTITYIGEVLVDYGVSAIVANQATNAGEYRVSISSIGNENYYVDSVSADFVIEKLNLTLTSTSDWAKVYDKETTYSNYEYQALENTNLVVSASYAEVNVGEVALTFVKSGTDVDNYLLALNGLVENVDYVVNGNEYVVKAGVANILPKSVNANGNGVKAFDGTTDTNGYVVDEAQIIDGDVINVTASYDNENVGVRTITLAIDNDNYVLADSVVDGEITARAISLEWTNVGTEYVYNGSAQGISVIVLGMVNGYEEKLFVTGAVETSFLSTSEFALVKQGSYSVSISVLSASNYALDGPTTASWTIAKKELAIVWNAENVFDYTATEQTYAPELVGVIDGDNVEMVVSGTKATNAGAYTSEVDSIDGVDANNYKLPTTVSSEWSINKVDILDISFVSAEYTYDGSVKDIAVSSLLTQFGEEVTVVYSGAEDGNKATNAGEYQVVATILESLNYNALTLTADLVIGVAQIDAGMTGMSYVYDGSVKSIAVDTLVTVYGDDISVAYLLVGETLDGTSVNDNTNGIKSAGSYTVTATLSAGTNYEEKVVSATLAITKKALVFTWQAFETNVGVYNGEEQGYTFLATGAIIGDDVMVEMMVGTERASVAVDVEYAKGYVTASEYAYAYSVLGLIGSDAYNYEIPDNVEASLTIVKRVIQVKGFSDGANNYALSASVSVEYARQNIELAPTFATNEVVDGDELEFVITNNVAINVGRYEMQVSLVDNDNYTMTAVTKVWEIKAKELNVEWQGATSVNYDGKVHEVVAVLTGVIDGDVINVSYQNNSAKNAGTYEAKITSIGNDNYRIADSNKTKKFTIKPVAIIGIELFDGEYLEDGEAYALELNKLTTQFGDKITYTMVTKDSNGKVVDNKVVSAGEYDVWVTINSGNNYQETTLQAKLIIKATRLESSKEDKQDGENAKDEVNIESEKGFAPGTEIKTECVEYSLRETPKVSATLKDGERVAMVYNVGMLYNGQSVDPDGLVTVKMLLPENLEETEFRLIGIVDGEEVELDYIIEDGYVVVETDKLESFVFVYSPSVNDYIEEFLVIIIICAIALLLLIIGAIVLSILMKKHEITFVTGNIEIDGGNVNTIKVRRGKNIELPVPTVSGMCYDGWYFDEECTAKTKATNAKSKYTLFAKTVLSNGKRKSRVPTVFTDNMEFKGWYVDPACTEKVDVKKLGRKNVTLYAKWGTKRKRTSCPIIMD